MSVINNESVKNLLNELKIKEEKNMTEMCLYGTSAVPSDTSFESGFAIMVRANYALSQENENLKKELEKRQWILCSERLPEKNIKILAQNEAKEISLEETDDVINISKGKINWLESYKFGNGLKIIAWMPLPESYKENVDQ